VAESYFELLTEQQGLPAKTFDPLGELKRIRRKLALRMHSSDIPDDIGLFTFQEKAEPNDSARPEPIALDAVIEKVNTIKRTLTVWHRSRSRFPMRQARFGIFRSYQTKRNRKHISSVVAQYIELSQVGKLDKINAALIATGIVGVIFGALNFFCGGSSDVSFSTLICASGATIVAIGFSGRFLAF
jgi:predicted small integral membrane protein